MNWTRQPRRPRLHLLPRQAGLFLFALYTLFGAAGFAQDDEAGDRPRLLVLELTGEAIPKTERRTLTTLIGVEVSGLVAYDVVTTQELEKLMTVEKDRQLLGCLDASCLAEVADAMGTERIIFGEVGKIGATYLMTLSLFDSLAARATERVVIKAQAIDGFVTQLPGALRELTAALRKAEGATAENAMAATDEKPASEPEAAPEAGKPESPSRGAAEEVAVKAETDGEMAEKKKAEAGGLNFLALSGWSMVGLGGVVAGAGMLYDTLSPTSADYILDVYDVVGPGIVFTGAFIAAGGAALALVPPLLEEGSDAQ